MRATIKRTVSVCLLLSLTLTACTGSSQPVHAPPASATLLSATTSEPTTQASTTPSAILVEDTPKPVATPDMTETAIRAFAATAEAVSTDVATQDGVWSDVEGTLSALGLLQSPTGVALATATPLPFPVSTQEVQVSWGTAIQYSFADPNDLLAARQAYEQYLDFISFRDGPPPENLEEALATRMVRDGKGNGPNSCLFSDTLRAMSGQAAHGRYIRLIPANGVVWDEGRIFLDVTPTEITTALGWNARAVLVELVEAKTGNIIKQERMNMAGTAHLTYVANTSQWLVENDNGGFYCEWIGHFD